MRIVCEGAPRDLGLDQGRAIGEGVDAELVRILRERPVDRGTAELGKDVARHFPHLAERMAGLAQGARVERNALVVALARASREPGFLFRPARALGTDAQPPGTTILSGLFKLSEDRCSVPIVRSSAPQGGFRSLELTLPWLSACLGGVNAEGLAVLLGPPGPAVQTGRGVDAEASCSAPALLFAQQCLERFDRVETAVEWCLSRPSDGSVSLFFADAQGARGALDLEAAHRHVVAPDASGALWRSTEPEGPPADAGLLVRLPADASPAARLAHRVCVRLDPVARSLELVLDRDGLMPDTLVERFALNE